jgi:hypothetical protein
MLTEQIMQSLIPAIGDLVAYRGRKYTVESHYANGSLIRHIDGVDAELKDETRPLLLVTDTDGNIDYIPAADCHILRTNPQYVMERLLTYLDKKGAIDWDQLDADHMQHE